MKRYLLISVIGLLAASAHAGKRIDNIPGKHKVPAKVESWLSKRSSRKQHPRAVNGTTRPAGTVKTTPLTPIYMGGAK